MNLNFLEFEQPIAELEAKIEELRLVSDDNEINIQDEITRLEGKSRALTESNLAYAHRMTTPMHLGLIAYWTGRKLRWDGKAEKFVDDKEADGRLGKPCRAPWTLPEA